MIQPCYTGNGDSTAQGYQQGPRFYQQVSISRTFLSALLILYGWYQRVLIEAATLDIAEVPADTVDHTHQASLHFRHPWREMS